MTGLVDIHLHLLPGVDDGPATLQEIHAGAAAALESAELELVAHGPPGRRWVLLEAPFDGIDRRLAASSARLRALA